MRSIAIAALIGAALAAGGAGPASAQPALCANPTAECGKRISPACLARVGAGALPADAGADCDQQYAAYAACLEQVATECKTPAAAPTPQAGAAGCTEQMALALWAAAERSKSADEYEALATACPGSPVAVLAAARAKRLRGEAPPAATDPEPKPQPGAAPVVAAPKPASPAALAPGAAFKDCAACPRMRVLPAGSVTVGARAGEAGRQAIEGPQRRVRLRRFAIGETEVTVSQYAAFAAATGRPTPEGCAIYDVDAGAPRPAAQATWRTPGFPFRMRRSHPVVCVSFADAEAYVAWLNATVGGGYRLPSESEWAYAARGGTTSRRPWGADARDDESCIYANVFDRRAARGAGKFADMSVRCDDGYTFVAPVAAFAPDAFGLFDMLGNVAEWTADCFATRLDALPTDGAPGVAGDCDQAALRGGHFATVSAAARSAFRTPAPRDLRANFIGFRVVKRVR